MTDAEIDADIARMIAVRHARKTLGYSYYETAHAHKPALSEVERRRRKNNYQKMWRTQHQRPDR